MAPIVPEKMILMMLMLMEATKKGQGSIIEG